MRRYILILIIAISSTFTCPKRGQRKRKSVCAARISALYYNRAQIDEIPKTLAADNTDIATQIYTEYGLTNNLEALLVSSEIG
jgi:ribosomal protein S6E (S10)